MSATCDLALVIPVSQAENLLFSRGASGTGPSS